MTISIVISDEHLCLAYKLACRLAQMRYSKHEVARYALARTGPRHMVSSGGMVCSVQAMNVQGMAAFLSAVCVCVVEASDLSPLALLR